MLIHPDPCFNFTVMLSTHKKYKILSLTHYILCYIQYAILAYKKVINFSSTVSGTTKSKQTLLTLSSCSMCVFTQDITSSDSFI